MFNDDACSLPWTHAKRNAAVGIWDQALLQPTEVAMGKLPWSPSREAAVPYVPIPSTHRQFTRGREFVFARRHNRVATMHGPAPDHEPDTNMRCAAPTATIDHICTLAGQLLTATHSYSQLLTATHSYSQQQAVVIDQLLLLRRRL
jgi:hypothetical protein